MSRYIAIVIEIPDDELDINETPEQTVVAILNGNLPMADIVESDTIKLTTTVIDSAGTMYYGEN